MNSKSSTTDRGASDEAVIVGHVGKPHGVRGEVWVRPLSDVPERFTEGRRLRARWDDGRTATCEVATSRPHKGGLIVAFAHCADRDQAAAMRGAHLEIDLEESPPAPEGAYYYYQLIGCVCFDLDRGELGRVSRVVEDGGGLLLQVESEGRKLMLPFVAAYLEEIDVEAKRIDFALPEGLVETCAFR